MTQVFFHPRTDLRAQMAREWLKGPDAVMRGSLMPGISEQVSRGCLDGAGAGGREGKWAAAALRIMGVLHPPS